jgi:predicted lipid-binding transport protein (Tim44 family)
MARRPYLILAVLVFWCLAVQICAVGRAAGLMTAKPAWAGSTAPSQASSAPGEVFGRAPRAAPSAKPPAADNPGLGNVFRFLAGGLLAGCLWSRLFGYPFYSYWPDEPFPLGLLDLTVVATFGYLGYLAVSRRLESRMPQGFTRRFSKPEPHPVPLEVDEAAKPGLVHIAARDPTFTLEAFESHVRGLIHDLHGAWNRQDLEPLRPRLSGNLLGFLQMGLRILALRQEISRLENLMLRRLAIVQAEGRGQQESITVRFEGQVLDYVLQSGSFRLLSGSLTYPVELKEFWRFERSGPGGNWQLQDIVDY